MGISRRLSERPRQRHALRPTSGLCRRSAQDYLSEPFHSISAPRFLGRASSGDWKLGTFEAPLALSSDVVFADNDGVSGILSMDALLWKLPLFDDVYYSMQGQNVMLVDVYLRDVETNVRNEYYELERTPVQSMMFLSAISQMWVFSV